VKIKRFLISVLSNGYLLIISFTLVAPFLIIALGSFCTDVFRPSISNFTLEYYFELTSAFWRSVKLSVIFAFTTVICTLALAIPAAYGLVRYNYRGKAFLNTLFMSPLMIAQSSFCAGLMIIYMRYIDLYDTFWGIVLPLVVVSIPYTLRPIMSSFQGIDISIEEVAESLGANKLKVLVYIILPLIGPGIIGGTILVFSTAINVFTITMFLGGVNHVPAAQRIYVDLQMRGLNPTLAAEANIMAVITLFVVLVLTRILGAKYLKGISF